MSQNDDTDDHDVRGESMRKTTRRGLLGALGVAGLASLGSSGASGNLGGGPEAGAMTDYQVPYYRVPESELDTPGVVGRRVEISSGGATYETGDQLVDLGDRWELVSPNYGSLSAGSLSSVYDRLIESASDLNNLGADAISGETIRVKQPDNPYELSVWPEIDVSHFALEFESPRAKNGEPIIKAGDGTDVGGFKFGYNSQISDIRVVNFGFDGNSANQDSSVLEKHGLSFDQVSEFDVIGFFIRDTSPQQIHGDGGTGIQITQNASDYTVEKGRIEDIGDQGINANGGDGLVKNIVGYRGYDRLVSTRGTDMDIRHIRSFGNADGAAVGVSFGSRVRFRDIRARDAAGVIAIRSSATDVEAHGLYQENCFQHGVDITTDGVNRVDIRDVVSISRSGSSNDLSHAIRVTDNPDNITISGAKCFNDGGFRNVRVEADGVELFDLDLEGIDAANLQILGSGCSVRGLATDGGGAVFIDSGASDTRFENADIGNLSDDGTRTRINGTLELSGSPTASNYDSNDAGLEILDTSTSPADVYRVLRNGSVVGPI